MQSEFNRTEALNAQLGQNGFEVANDTNSHTGEFFAIQVLADAVFSSFTAENITGTFTGITVPAGHVVFGDISEFTLTSGTVIAYKK